MRRSEAKKIAVEEVEKGSPFMQAARVVDRVLDRLEAAGLSIPWEPEPVELPESIAIFPGHGKEGHEISDDARGWTITEEPYPGRPVLRLHFYGDTTNNEARRQADAFVARWNADSKLRRGLRELVERWLVHGTSYAGPSVSELECLLDDAEAERKGGERSS